MFEISRDPSGRRPVTAVIVVPPVISVPELVMKALVPLITHFPSRSSAFVCDVAGVAAGAGLGEPEAPQHLAARERDQILLLLLARCRKDRTASRRARRARPS